MNSTVRSFSNSVPANCMQRTVQGFDHQFNLYFFAVHNFKFVSYSHEKDHRDTDDQIIFRSLARSSKSYQHQFRSRGLRRPIIMDLRVLAPPSRHGWKFKRVQRREEASREGHARHQPRMLPIAHWVTECTMG